MASFLSHKVWRRCRRSHKPGTSLLRKPPAPFSTESQCGQTAPRSFQTRAARASLASRGLLTGPSSKPSPAMHVRHRSIREQNGITAMCEVAIASLAGIASTASARAPRPAQHRAWRSARSLVPRPHQGSAPGSRSHTCRRQCAIRYGLHTLPALERLITDHENLRKPIPACAWPPSAVAPQRSCVGVHFLHTVTRNWCALQVRRRLPNSVRETER